MKKVIEIPKGATIEIRKDKVVIEYEEAFVPKNGDFCAIDEDDIVHRTLFISNGRTARDNHLSYHAAKIGTDFRITPIDGLSGTPRPMMEDERTELLEALHAIDKDWDAEKMELVDFKWVPKEGDLVYYASTAADEKVHQMTYSGAAYHHRLAERGLLFRTRAEAVACTERMIEAAKQK